ncbi:MAG: dienelactone hydrolase family protein [Caulobacteraceae bacterium]
MGEVVRLTNAEDGFAFEAYHAPTPDARRGGLVVIPAIWGVTPHIRELCDSYAEDGYEVLAPSLFDRFEPGFPGANTDPPALARRMDYVERLGFGERALGDVQAVIDALAPPVALMGFCFGGTVAWLAACRARGLAAVSSFYGGHIVRFRHETPLCPTHLHLGRRDELIPQADVAAIVEAQPELPVFQYDAGHAFVAPGEHVADAARLSRLRTLQLFHRAGGGRGEGG